MGFTARVNENDFENYFKVIGIDDDEDYKTVRKWLEQDVKGGANGSNLMFMELMYINVRALIQYYPETYMTTEKANGDKILLPVFGFKKALMPLAEKRNIEITRKKMYDGWDCVRLTEKEYYKMNEIIQDFDIPYIQACALEKFCIRIDKFKDHPDHIQVIYYELNAKKKQLKAYVNQEEHPFENVEFLIDLEEAPVDETGKHTIKASLANEFKEDQMLEWVRQKIVAEEEMTNLTGLAFMFFDINRFMLHFKDVSCDVKEIECKQQSHKSHSLTNSRTVSRMFKCYTLKRNWISKVNRKKAEFKCLAWGVRGHWRHYRNGKRVFVNAYVKGKEKDKYKGKDYVLFPKSEDENNESA